MIDKGYPFPLYSLDLQPALSDDGQGGRSSLLTTHGRLIVSAGLAERAADVAAPRCENAVHIALSYHEAHLGAFRSNGLDRDWARSMAHWCHGHPLSLIHRDAQRLQFEVLCQQSTLHHRGLMLLARKAVARLLLCARLAGIDRALLATGPVPRNDLPFVAFLSDLCSAAADPPARGLLHSCGFGPRDLAALAQLHQDLSSARAARADLARAASHNGDCLLVIRAALIGDLARLSQIAQAILLPQAAAALQMRRLLNLPPRRKPTTPATPSSPPTPALPHPGP